MAHPRRSQKNMRVDERMEKRRRRRAGYGFTDKRVFQVENINMKKESAKGGQGIFGSNIFGAAQEEFKSIKDLRNAAQGLLDSFKRQ